MRKIYGHYRSDHLVSIGRIFPWGGGLAKKSIIEGRAINLVLDGKNLLLRGHCLGLLKPNVLSISMLDLWSLQISKLICNDHRSDALTYIRHLVSIGRIYPWGGGLRNLIVQRNIIVNRRVTWCCHAVAIVRIWILCGFLSLLMQTTGWVKKCPLVRKAPLLLRDIFLTHPVYWN